MAASAVTICNLALSRIGSAASVSSIEKPDGSQDSLACARMYPIALGTLLDRHNWAFATKRATAAKLSNFDPTPWKFAYAFPTDCRRIIDLQSPEYESVPPALRGKLPRAVEFEVVSAGGTVAVLTNCESPNIRYIVKDPAPSFFTDSFVDALAWLLASYLAGQAVRGDSGFNYTGYCYKYYLTALDAATRQDSTQTRKYTRHVPEGIRSRF